MPTSRKLVVQHSVTPQEQVSFTGGQRWYLDSDVRKKLGSVIELKADSQCNVGSSVATFGLEYTVASTVDFVYIKNTTPSGDDGTLLVSLDNGDDGYPIVLTAQEAFATTLDKTVAHVKLKSVSGSVNYETLFGEM